MKFRLKPLALSMAVAACWTLPTVSAQAADTLTGLSDLPGGAFISTASAVNADGSVVVGEGVSAGTTGYEAFRWTQGGGMVGLGDLPGGVFQSSAYGVSADGSVVVGYGSSASGTEAFRWTQGGGMVGLGDLPGGWFNSLAYDVNADGSVVVGHGDSVSGQEAFRWTQGSGMVALGDLLGGAFFSRAFAVNADGTVVVGWGTSASGREAFRWTQSDGMVALGDLPGGIFDSRALAVSGNGSVLAGFSESANGREAFRWTQSSGMVGLGDLPGGGFYSTAYGVNADGSVVVGYGTTASGDEAFRWTQAIGMQRVADWLAAAGVSAAGWTKLTGAEGVNANGDVVVGYGDSTNGIEAFIARVGSATDNTGLVGLTDLNNSVASTVQTHVQLEGLNALTLNGAHHRNLMDIAMTDGSYCGWVSGDIGRNNRNDNGHGWMSLAEIGACHDFKSQNLRAGIGIGHSQARQDQVYGGKTDLNGEYLLGELDWVASPSTSGSSLVASVLGMVGRWDADLTRGYSFGTAQSSGNTDLDSWSLRARLDWRDAFKLGSVSFTPTIQYTNTHTKVDGYQESGGTAPAQYDSQTHTAKESRLGLTGAYPVSDATTLRGHVEWVHRFDDEGAAVSGTANVLQAVTVPFNFSGNKIRQNWSRVGAEVDHKISKSSVISVSANVASSGQDADVSAGASWKLVF